MVETIHQRRARLYRENESLTLAEVGEMTGGVSREAVRLSLKIVGEPRRPRGRKSELRGDIEANADRLRAGLSAAELGAEIGCSKWTVRYWREKLAIGGGEVSIERSWGKMSEERRGPAVKEAARLWRQGMTGREIAEAMDSSLKVAWSRIHKARLYYGDDAAPYRRPR